MLMKKLLAVACAGLFASSGAHALTSLSQLLKPGVNNLSDDNAEVVLKYDGALNGGTGGYRAFNPIAGDLLSAGDIFVGIVGITSFPDADTAGPYNEVSAVYALQVTSVTDLANEVLTPALAAFVNGAVCGAATVTTCSAFGFSAATGVGANVVSGLNGAVSLLNANYGTAIGPFANSGATSWASVQEDVSPDFSRTPVSFATGFANAADGTQRFVFDILGGDSFSGSGPANILQVLPAFGGPNFGSGVGGLTGSTTITYQNVPGWVVAPTVNITGNISAGDGLPFSIWSDTSYRIFARDVPEPATLGLLGLALLGLGAAGRRSRASRAAA